MKKRNKNQFGKRKLDDTANNDFVIKSEPLQRGINNLKSKYFAENSYENNYQNNNNNDFNIPVKKPNNNNSIPQSFYSTQQNNFGMNQPQNQIINPNPSPYYSAEYKINSNIPNLNNNNMNNFTNMMSYGNYNNLNMNNLPGMNNVTNLIRPMGINPFAPPTANNNNPNLNFNYTNIPGNNGIFNANHNIFNQNNNNNENNQNN